MAQFDVYRNPNPSTATDVPYLLDIQSDFLNDLATRVVVPLMREGGLPSATRLNPRLTVEGLPVVLSTQTLAAVRKNQLGEPVASLASRRDEIVAALDFLISGF